MKPQQAMQVNFGNETVEVELEQRELSFAFGEARAIAWSNAYKLPVDFNALRARIKAIRVSDADAEAIRLLVEQFERMLPSQVPQSLGTVTTNPYYSITNGGVTVIDSTELNKWLQSTEFNQLKVSFQGDQQHQIAFNEMEIHAIDERTASVHYQIAEKLPNGEMLYGNSAVTVLKGTDGVWRISVHSQHPVTG